MIKAGDLFKKGDTMHVVTVANDGKMLESMPLEQFVNWNVPVIYEGKEMYIHEVIAQRCDEYMENKEIKSLSLK